jgi:A/G-specific adenine glycosylase
LSASNSLFAQYFEKWMSLFPTIKSLSDATLEQVNQVWSGLGYYRRAKNLHDGAQKVVSSLGGLLPTTASDLQKSLPGVGPYTAGAIASIAFGEPAAAVDGNVVRVVSRLCAIGGYNKEFVKSFVLFIIQLGAF